MQQIALLTQQVEGEVRRKEDQRSQWEREKDQIRAVSAEQGTPEAVETAGKGKFEKYILEGRQPAFTFAN